ncbi:MAG: hypothetical protein R2873_00660 [Caldilineaceae bacterium]
MSDKLINTFHLRRKLNAEIETLGITTNEADLLEKVRLIAQKYEPEMIIATLRRFLDTGSSQLRGGLGRLATLLPYEEVTAVLRHEAANRNNPTQARLTAALILERFLQAEVAAALMSDLKDPEVVVMQSLEEAIVEGKQNRYVLLDYVRQMRQENEDVAYMVIDLLDLVPAGDCPELLRLIAYDARPMVARTAMDKLASLRSTEVSYQAAEALDNLRANLPPVQAEYAARCLRKLRFSGVTYDPPPMQGWRALLTPVSLTGEQDLWFLHSNEESGILIGLRLDTSTGLLETFGSEDVEARYLPPHRDVGELISIAITSNTPMVFLEVPLDYARWYLQQILTRHWQQVAPRPLPAEYTLHNLHLFRYQTSKLPPQLDALLSSGSTSWEKMMQSVRGQNGSTDSAHRLAEIAAEFLRHPAMSGWFFQEQAMGEAILRATSQGGSTDPAAMLPPLMAQMFDGEAGAAMALRLQTALQAQAAWLSIAGHDRNAGNAMLLAESFNHYAIAEHPLTALMVEVGLMLMLNRRTIR